MKKNFAFLTVLILAFFLVFPALNAAEPDEEKEPITFVANVDELAKAEKEKGSLKGLALWSDFYDSANPDVKLRIEALMREVLNGNKLQIVFLYGYSLRKELVKKFLPQLDCEPTLFAGTLKTISFSPFKEASVNYCDTHFPESEFRGWILDRWFEEKEKIKSDFGTLP
ncbi:hypothetical protein HYT01_00620 [Candidatus Giovannonibacteria bacterium]|nr:hypothetical protein [Candidatus Giovannonibacteria bacterium]